VDQSREVPFKIALLQMIKCLPEVVQLRNHFPRTQLTVLSNVQEHHPAMALTKHNARLPHCQQERGDLPTFSVRSM
jgi:hypothetical protein